YGFVDNILTNEREIYACVIGKEIKTKDILSSKEKCRKINESGKKCINSIIKKPTLENLFKLSKEFAITTGLASSEIVDAIEEVNKYGMASMCMLGNSLFAVGNVKKILQKYGRIYECMIGSCGYVHDY
ncbi:MAG: GHMP kinase, partial [Candidatus Thermoplasmatota archaeon]